MTSPVWIAAVRRGIADAMDAAGAKRRRWSIVLFEGTVVDTSDEDAWAAAVMAVFDALNVKATLDYERTWVVTVATGLQLRSTVRAQDQDGMDSR